MKKLITIVTFCMLAAYGCSKVNFGIIPDESCEASSECVEVNGMLNWKFSIKIGAVDILFVDDNSGSMSVEQSKMGQRFDKFIEALENRGIDYQIAVITTDVSASPGNAVPKDANGFGAFQDGKFLIGPNGKNILKPSDGTLQNRIDWFADVIERNETKICEYFVSYCGNVQNSGECISQNLVGENCPSGDERGIYALNLAIERANTEFFRTSSHLAVVVLSDEDERSGSSSCTADVQPLDANYDIPPSLVSRVYNQFDGRKTLSMHSLIVPPEDKACRAMQDGQLDNKWICGAYGEQYARLAEPTTEDKALKEYDILLDVTQGGSTIGTICADSYGAQLTNIGNVVSDNSKKIQLPCDPDSLDVTVTPVPAVPAEYVVSDTNLLTITTPVESGTTIDVDLKCNKAL